MSLKLILKQRARILADFLLCLWCGMIAFCEGKLPEKNWVSSEEIYV